MSKNYIYATDGKALKLQTPTSWRQTATTQHSIPVPHDALIYHDTTETSLSETTMQEAYITASEDNITQYLSVLENTACSDDDDDDEGHDCTKKLAPDIDVDAEIDENEEHFNVTLKNNYKIITDDGIIEEIDQNFVTKCEKRDEEEGIIDNACINNNNNDADDDDGESMGNDKMFIFNVESSDDFYGLQIVRDAAGNTQKYQFKFRHNSEGQLEAIPETIQLLDEEEGRERDARDDVSTSTAASASEMKIFVRDDHSDERILPDQGFENFNIDIFDDNDDIKPILKHELVEESDAVEFDASGLKAEQYSVEEIEIGAQTKLNTVEFLTHDDEDYVDDDEDGAPPSPPHIQETHIQEYPSTELYQLPGAGVEPAESVSILKSATPRLNQTDDDKRLVFYVVQDAKENDATAHENVDKSGRHVSPLDLYKSKRFARNKNAIQAKLLHNFINDTKIVQAPERKDRLPRKQIINPVERPNEDIIVQEVIVSAEGYIEATHKNDPRRLRSLRVKDCIEIESDDEEAANDVIEIHESSEDDADASSPTKRKRGRPKNKESQQIEKLQSPLKKLALDDDEEKPEIQCPKCTKTFPSENSLKTHLQHHSLLQNTAGGQSQSYKCARCGVCFKNNALLRTHTCKKMMCCVLCKKRFQTSGALALHKRNHAKGELCKSTTTAEVRPRKIKQSPLRSDTRIQATDAATYKCTNCGRAFGASAQLEVHMRTHYTCTTCGHTFNSRLNLGKHVRESCVKLRTSVGGGGGGCKKGGASTIPGGESGAVSKIKMAPPPGNGVSQARTANSKLLLQKHAGVKLARRRQVASTSTLSVTSRNVDDDGSEEFSRNLRKRTPSKLFSGIPANKRMQETYSILREELKKIDD